METLHPGVYVLEVPSAVRPIEGVSTSTAAFIGYASKGPIAGTRLPNGTIAQPLLVTSFTDYTRKFGGFRADSFLTYAVRAFFDNGGKRVYIVRVTGQGTSSPPSSPPTSPPGVIPGGAATPAISLAGASLRVSAANEGQWGNDIRVAILNSSDGDTADNFKLQVLYDSGSGFQVVETYDNVTFLGSPSSLPGTVANSLTPADYARTVINARSEYIAITADFMTRPANTPLPTPPYPPGFPLAGGSDGPLPQAPGDYIGHAAATNSPDPVTGTGIHALDKITDVNLIAIPGAGDQTTVQQGVEYCKNRPLQDCFFIGDIGSVNDTPAARQQGSQTDVVNIDQARNFAVTFPGKSAGDYGAVYFPWLRSPDPLGTGRNPTILLPPSGFMAGIYARIDNSRGVFKAPAGLEAGAFGAVSPQADISDTEQDLLNPVSVNAIRTVPGGGIVSWGTRTAGSDASWRYIPVRRMAIFLRVSIYYGIQWAVFEPNDEPLWASLRLNIRAFMLTQFRAGAFQGSKPDDAFFVKCDSNTTTQADIDLGIVNILVGFAPLKPAEFVILKLSQKVNQPAT
jgi:phage tail sheath protein FI